MKIRTETPKDFKEIYELIQTAFKTAEVSNGEEQNFTNSLRCSEGYLPELAFVTEDNNKLIAHIMLTLCYINTPQGKHKTLILAPLSVAQEYRRKSVGSVITQHALAKAKELGYESCLLVGNPAYYCRFGFVSADTFGITNTNEIPQKFILALELKPGALAKAKGGTITFPE